MTLTKPISYERRSAHRYKVNFPVELVLEDGSVLPVEACDLSESGLQFRCDSWVADEIEPRGIQNHPLDQIRLKAIADIPYPENQEAKLYARCRVVVARRLSQEEYLLGIEFIDFENGSESRLKEYIKQCAQNRRKRAGF